MELEGLATGFEFCNAVGDVPVAIVSSGEFTRKGPEAPRKGRPGCEGFFYVDDGHDHQGIVCPHLVQENAADAGTVGNMAVATGVAVKSSYHHALETCTGDANISPSPSPPAFEPYVICTKVRSETSCSNESQCSSSSGERLEGWTHDRILMSPGSPSGGHHCEDQHLSPSLPIQRQTRAGSDHGGEENDHVMMLISAGHDSPEFLCKTKPVLPPEDFLASDIDRPPSSPLFFPSINPPPLSAHPVSSSPTVQPSSSTGLHLSLCDQRARALTFHHCKAGEEGGTFSADYLGVKDVDMYIKSINSVAKELAMSQRPKEIQVFVTSERIRLAPPNSPTLFRSFLVKDILLMRKCSKNKRIVGVMVWKRKVGVPSCHILRCHDDLVASALYTAVWEQTQKMDEVIFSKGDKSSNQVPRPLSTEAQSSGDSGGQSFSAANTTEFLHKLPAIYIGSVSALKSHTIDSVAEKVLMESRPSLAKLVTISLSLQEIRFVEDKKELAGNSRETDEIFLSHDTSRIRSMGAYSKDKRFAGYVIKEEGKPLFAHVIKCNSAALMVSFAAFLRQSCQVMAHQRGGAFYEELSTDESEDWEASLENSPPSGDSTGIIKRIRSLTYSISQLTSTSPSSPSFLSHMNPNPDAATPITTTSPKGSPNIHKKSHDFQLPGPSPHDFSDDEYAKFLVTYIGSATQESALTQQSVEDAMGVFAAEGTAAGRAAVVKNTVHLQVSLLGINLTDKTRKMFIHRNYPCKTIAGYCRHREDPKLFAFASYRPGYPHIMKVHVFRCGTEPVKQILDAIAYWLKIEPISP